MSGFRQTLKRIVFRLLGREPEAVVVSFWTGTERETRPMLEEVRRLIPDREHYVVRVSPAGEPGSVCVKPGSAWTLYRQLRRELRRRRVGMAPVLFTDDRSHGPLRCAAFLLAPGKILAYNARGERLHLRLRCAIASWLFLRGTPLDRIYLRPWWLCPWKRDRSSFSQAWQVFEGRALSPERPRIAVLSPYFPYPLSHGGAVRIFHMLREMAAKFDVFLFAFAEGERIESAAPVLEFCAKVIVAGKPRYREPRWSSLSPPEVGEYRSPTMKRLLETFRRDYGIRLLQTEYTHLADYGGDVLVEHDVTFDLYQQVHRQRGSLSAWWDWRRWRRFERKAVRRFRRVVVMSEKDAAMLAVPQSRVIPNGADLERFQPQPERDGHQLLFIGSFRHFPNVAAYRFFTEQVWPALADRFPEMQLTVVAGPEPLLYWRTHTNSPEPPPGERIRLLEFVSDVRPLYAEANVVIVPTTVSAGTNVKVLEAMAMERVVVSRPSGCAGLGLRHGENVWIAESAEAFAEGVARLAADAELRSRIARAAREHCERHFDWKRIGETARTMLEELLEPPLLVRQANRRDLKRMAQIQAASPQAARWDPTAYLSYDCRVAVVEERIAGFLASRTTGGSEREILNLAVDPVRHRQGVATALLRDTLARYPGEFFLEVRESNEAARNLYRKMGFRDAGIRRMYYDTPVESAIVMRFQS